MSLVELLAASAVTLAIMGGVLGAVLPAQTLALRQAERIDAAQRLRVGVDTLTREVRDATFVTPGADDGAIEVRQGAARRAYYLSRGEAQLRFVDEGGTDLPVLDGVTTVRFEHAAGSVRVHLAVAAGRDTLSVTWDVALRNPP